MQGYDYRIEKNMEYKGYKYKCKKPKPLKQSKFRQTSQTPHEW